MAAKKEAVQQTQTWGVVSVVALALLSLGCSWVICRMIAKAEKL